MKTLKIRSKLLRESAEVIPGATYQHTHVYKNGREYIVFAGNISSGTWTEVVVHPFVSPFNMAVLQIILSYGEKVDYRIPLLRIINWRPDITMSQMCELLQCDASFVEKHLRLPQNQECGKIPLANLYVLKKIPKPSELWILRARTLKPHDFGPMAFQHIKDLRAKARKKSKSK